MVNQKKIRHRWIRMDTDEEAKSLGPICVHLCSCVANTVLNPLCRLNRCLTIVASASCLLMASAMASAQQSKPVESDYYQIIKIPVPSDIVLECGGMEWMPDGKLAVSTRRGDIYFLENPLAPNVKRIRFTKWATGMHE